MCLLYWPLASGPLVDANSGFRHETINEERNSEDNQAGAGEKELIWQISIGNRSKRPSYTFISLQV